MPGSLSRAFLGLSLHHPLAHSTRGGPLHIVKEEDMHHSPQTGEDTDMNTFPYGNGMYRENYN